MAYKHKFKFKVGDLVIWQYGVVGPHLGLVLQARLQKPRFNLGAEYLIKWFHSGDEIWHDEHMLKVRSLEESTT